MSAWDHFVVCKQFPGPGEYTIVQSEFEQAGGTTANTCAALGKLGLEPYFASYVGDDALGTGIIESLNAAGCDTSGVLRLSGTATDRSIIVVSGVAAEVDRTIFWIQGARPSAGAQFDVETILDHRWVLIDVDDPRLRQFWLDLPAHRSPRTRLIGTMIYLVEMPKDEGLRQALQHDVMFGNRREFLTLAGTADLDAAIEIAQRRLPGSACEVMFVSLGAEGAIAITDSDVTRIAATSVAVVDTTGAGDAFAAGCIWGILDRADHREILTRGTVVGGFACTAYGARAGLPSRPDADSAVAAHRKT